MSRPLFLALGSIFICFGFLDGTAFALSEAGVRVKGIYFSVEVARTEAEWRKGLMGRDRLSPREGMLFLGQFERDQVFWMKDTPISLDIIYISKAKRIVSIAKKTEPLSTKQIPSAGPAQHVLEILGGEADALKLKPGDRVEFVNIK